MNLAIWRLSRTRIQKRGGRFECASAYWIVFCSPHSIPPSLLFFVPLPFFSETRCCIYPSVIHLNARVLRLAKFASSGDVDGAYSGDLPIWAPLLLQGEGDAR